MDYHELKDVYQKLDAELSKPQPDFSSLRKYWGRIISHMQSEQATLVEHGRRIVDLENQTKVHDEALYGDRKKPEDNPGLVNTMREIKRLMQTIRYIGIAIFIALAVGGIKWLGEFFLKAGR